MTVNKTRIISRIIVYLHTVVISGVPMFKSEKDNIIIFFVCLCRLKGNLNFRQMKF